MSPHNLDNEGSRVREGSGFNVIDGFTYPLQSSGCADGHVGHGHVIVNGADKADNFQVSVRLCLLFSNLAYSLV